MFQVESRAQMSCLPRMKPVTFYDMVVQVAIIRPGPIVGKMVHPYLNRRQGREKVDCLHPSLEPVLQRTLGVPLFQEQLLRMAMIAAGFTGGEAEELRRAMGFKRSEKRMADIELKLRAGMARNGIAGEAQENIVRSITSFALYGFPESHAASFALIAYASAYLKCHYLAEFTCAHAEQSADGILLAGRPDQGRAAARAARAAGGRDVSEWKCTVGGRARAAYRRREPCPCGWDCAMRAGCARSGAGDSARAGERAFSSVDDLAVRVRELRKDELNRLAEIGALNSAGEAAPPGRAMAVAAGDPAGGSAAGGAGGNGRAVAAVADDDGRAAVGGLPRDGADGRQASDGVAADRDERARAWCRRCTWRASATARWCGSPGAWWCGSGRGRRRDSCS